MFLPVILSVIEEKKKLYSEFEKKAVPSMDRLYNFALRITGNKNDAAKLLKKTYSKAFWFFDHLDKEIIVKDWLFRIMRNTFFNEFSKQVEITDEYEQFYAKIKSSFAEKSLPENEIFNNLKDVEVAGILFSLPENLRIVIILCDIEGFSYEQIADFVDIPVGAVISRIQRARRMFFTELYSKRKEP